MFTHMTKTSATVLIALASVALLIIMAIISLDVVARNLSLFYIRGVMDYVGVTQIVMASAAIPATFVTGRHLVVEIGTFALRDKAKAWLEAVWLLLAVPMMLKMGQLVWAEGVHLAERGRNMGIHGWSPNTYHAPVAIGLFLSAAACLVIGLSRASGRLRF